MVPAMLFSLGFQTIWPPAEETTENPEGALAVLQYAKFENPAASIIGLYRNISP
jgi:hypothetical protein